MPLDHTSIVTNEVPAELLDQWEAEVNTVMGLDDADLLRRVRDMADPLHALVVEELAARYEDCADETRPGHKAITA